MNNKNKTKIKNKNKNKNKKTQPDQLKNQPDYALIKLSNIIDKQTKPSIYSPT